MSRHKDNGKLIKDYQRDDKVLNRTEMETAQTTRSFSYDSRGRLAVAAANTVI